MYVCVNAMYACMFLVCDVCMWEFMHVYVHACAYVCICVMYVFMYSCICGYVGMHVCVYECMCLCMDARHCV